MSNDLQSAATVLGGPPLPAGRRCLVMWVCAVSLFMTCVDIAIVMLALPGIQADLHVGVDGLEWVTDAYLLALSSALLLAGDTADRLGRRRLFLVGLTVFTAGSVCCGLATCLGVLVAARVVQALGAALVGPSSLSIVRHAFTDPAERARAFGVWAAVFGVATACGPIVGGPLIDLFGWRAVFLVNAPFGVLAIVAGRFLIPESRAGRPRRLDVRGQVFLVMLIAPLTGAVIEGSTTGWTDPLILGGFLVAAVGLAGFVVVERRGREPMLDLRYFALPGFRTANLAVLLAFAVMAGFLFIISLYLQQERQLSSAAAALALLPLPGGIVLFAPLAGWWVARRGAGLGMVNPPITALAVAALPGDRAGVAAAMTGTSRQLGNALGVAVMGSMLGTPAANQLTATTHRPFALGAVLGILISVAALRYRRTEVA